MSMDFDRIIIADAAMGLDRPLGTLLSEGLRAFDGDGGTLSALSLRLSFLYMLLHGMIRGETYDYLSPFFRYRRWEADEYFLNDVRYLPQGKGSGEGERIEGLRINPAEVKQFVMAILRCDDLAGECLCLDSPKELIESACGCDVEGELIKKVAFGEWDGMFRGDACIAGGRFFYFEPEGQNGVTDWKLCTESVKKPMFGSKREQPKVLSHGMRGTILRQGEQLYFPVKNAAACLHVDVAAGSSEILQNVRILGLRHDGTPVYVNYMTDKVCLLDGGRERAICDYDRRYRYAAADGYVLATPFDFSGEEFPFRVSFDGTRGEASPEEKAWAFWETFLSRNTNLTKGLYVDMRDSMATFLIGALAKRSPLTIEGMEMVMGIIRDNGRWWGGKAYPFTGILRAMRRAGIDPKADVSREVYNLVRYSMEVLAFPKASCVFAPVFYYIIYRLSKRDDFASLLRDDPERLFRDDAAAAAERRRQAREEAAETLAHEVFPDAADDNIGLFDVCGKQVNAFVISKKKGRLEDTLVKCKNTATGYRGSVYYDILKDKYIIDWPERDDALMEEVLRVFNHCEWEVEFSFAGKGSRKGGEAFEG